MGGYESDSSTGSSSDDVALRGRGKPPTVHSHWHWNEKRDNPFKAADFKGKNADKIVRSSSYFVGHGENRRMVSHTYVCWRGKGLFEKLEKGLLAKQDRKHVSVDGQDYVTKEMGNKYEQIPFHSDLEPFFDYFLAGVKTLGSLKSFELSNIQLPESLLGKLVPVFESRSNHHGKLLMERNAYCLVRASADNVRSCWRRVLRQHDCFVAIEHRSVGRRSCVNCHVPSKQRDVGGE